MNLILCDDDKVFLNKLEIRIRGLCQKHKIAVKMECYVSAKEMLEGIKNLDAIPIWGTFYADTQPICSCADTLLIHRIARLPATPCDRFHRFSTI